jgi:hypothetical protein
MMLELSSIQSLPVSQADSLNHQTYVIRAQLGTADGFVVVALTLSTMGRIGSS